MKKQIYSGLQFFCRNGDNDSVFETLKQYQKQEDLIDLFNNDGLFFKSAISHDNNALLQILLDYMYSTKQIEKEPKDNNTNQSIKYNKLQQVLKEAKNEFNTSKAVVSLIDNICNEDTDYNSDSDSLHDQEITQLFSSLDNLEQDSTLEKKLSGDNSDIHDSGNDTD